MLLRLKRKRTKTQGLSGRTLYLNTEESRE